MKIKSLEWNVKKTGMPVREWMSLKMASHTRIGGLLDYGYTEGQIAEMIAMTYEQVRAVMEQLGYKTVDKLKIIYEEDV